MAKDVFHLAQCVVSTNDDAPSARHLKECTLIFHKNGFKAGVNYSGRRKMNHSSFEVIGLRKYDVCIENPNPTLSLGDRSLVELVEEVFM